MKTAILSVLSLLFTVSTVCAQDDQNVPTTIPEESPSPVNRNNIRYVDFHTYNIGTRETCTLPALDAELSPTYFDVYSTSDLWKQGWFMSASFAGSAFVGDPIGCEDLFGRIKPTLQLSAGKWIIPSTGLRVQYQGFDLKNGELENQKYHAFMGDWMIDLLSFGRSEKDAPRTSLVPFAGCGYMFNAASDKHSFGLHYGLIASFNLTKKLSINLELSSTNTFRDFDGVGNSCRLGDQLINVSGGLSYAIGSKHYRNKVINAGPYAEQNQRLRISVDNLLAENRYLSAELNTKDNVLAEYRKILEIKGWLGETSTASNIDLNISSNDGPLEVLDSSLISKKVLDYPYNNYKGLNMLRERLKRSEKKDYTNPNCEEPCLFTIVDSKDSKSVIDVDLSNITEEDSIYSHCWNLVSSRKVSLGPSVFFFFKQNSDQLTDTSQLINLDEIAKLIVIYNLKVKVTGAADSATGNVARNVKLGESRAAYIMQELIDRGVNKEKIKKENVGGIETYTPTLANRNCRITLYF